jgi:hypothetical protein
MNFLRNLFSNTNSKDEFIIPSPTQTIPGVEPIVVYMVEHFHPNIEEQKYAFTFLLNHTEENDTLAQLSLIRMGIKNLENIMEKNPSLTVRYAVYSDGFPNLKAAKKWVKSVVNSSQ